MPPAAPGAAVPPPHTQSVPPLLICEALGFSPQLLLDDIINIANNAVQDGVNGMEEFLHKWVDERAARISAQPPSGSAQQAQEDDESTQELVEQGLVAFQTLLEYHTDIAFDFFEAWCLRNIFYVPPDLPVVLPHQAGLDLSPGMEKREKELMEEVERLRRDLENQRRLHRLLTHSVRTSARKRRLSTQRLALLQSLSPASTTHSLSTLRALPPKLLELYTVASSLPPLDTLPTPQPVGGTGKRQWETSKTGYEGWAVERLLARNGGEGQGQVEKILRGAEEVGALEEVLRAGEAVGARGEDKRERMQEGD